MGSFRYVLAVMVVLSHTGVSFLGYAPGVVAVVSFFLISGYVMTLLIERYYNAPERIGAFYLDRAVRLYPQFLLYTAISLALTKIFAPATYPVCGAREVALNLLMFPLDIYQLIDLQCMLVPQAWSLGLEMSFYIIFPVLLIFARNFVRWITVCSILVFLAAYSVVINSDTYGYRLLPGTLFIFLIGASLAKPDIFWRRQVLAIWLGAALLFGWLFFDATLYSAPYTKEVLLGLLIGVPALYAIKQLKFSRLDDFLGDLSYGVFLSHYLFVFLYIYAFDGKQFGIEVPAAVVVLSTASALLSYYLVELPCIKWRRRLRLKMPRGRDDQGIQPIPAHHSRPVLPHILPVDSHTRP